jgi:hypothetical protein
MKQIFLAMTIFAATMMAADATGTWTGTLLVTGKDPGPAHLMLKQDGSKLTGTAGPTEDEQHQIENGKAENGTLTFDVSTGETVMRFKLRHAGDEIKGDVTREREGSTQTATLSVKRAN